MFHFFTFKKGLLSLFTLVTPNIVRPGLHWSWTVHVVAELLSGFAAVVLDAWFTFNLTNLIGILQKTWSWLSAFDVHIWNLALLIYRVFIYSWFSTPGYRGFYVHISTTCPNCPGKLTRSAEKFDTVKLFPRLSRLSGSLQVNLIAYVHICPKIA